MMFNWSRLGNKTAGFTNKMRVIDLYWIHVDCDKCFCLVKITFV